MKKITLVTCCIAMAGIMLAAPPGTRAAVLANPGFETGDFTGWGQFGVNHYVEGIAPHSGSWSLKLYREWNGLPNNVGVIQDFAALPGQLWYFSGYLRNGNGGGDYLGLFNEAYLKMEFFKADDGFIGAYEYNVANGGGIDWNTPQDNAWIYNYFTYTTPAETARIRATVIHALSDDLGGAGSSWFDDLEFGHVVPEPNAALLLLVGVVMVGGLKRRLR